MPSKNVSSHIHRYKKVNISRDAKPFIVFKCTKPVCTHYIAFHLAEGKLCECNRCAGSMILTKLAMTLTKPHCPECVQRKKIDGIKTVDDYLEGTET